MPTALVPKFAPRHKMASASIAISVLEIVTVWGAVAITHSIAGKSASPRLISIASAAWVLGSVLSTTFAVAAIVFERRREIGLLSLLAAVAAFIICGLPMLV